MWSFLVRRLLQSVAIVFVVASLTFFLIHAAPGDPISAVLGDARIPESVRDTLRKQAGLDQPVVMQYVRHLGLVASGHLGYSYSHHLPVSTVLAHALPPTLLLMGTALGAGFAIGIGLGALQGVRAGSRFDQITSAITTATATIPDFWLALGAMLLFAMRLRVFPTGGMTTPVEHELMPPLGRVFDTLRHLVLPASCLGVITASVVARYQRASMIDAWREDCVRTARAAGVPRRRLVFRFALRNALLPVVTLLGLALPALTGGAVFVESVFSWPGMGRTAVDALSMRDYPLVLGVAIVASSFVALGGIVADLLYAAVDPRVRRA